MVNANRAEPDGDQLTARAWIERYAAAIGVPAPSAAEVELLLELAGVAAHASHRRAAPISCWLAAMAGVEPAAALAAAQRLAAEHSTEAS